MLNEVGLVPKKLDLAVGYLRERRLVLIHDYLERLRKLRTSGQRQGPRGSLLLFSLKPKEASGKLSLPEASLGLEMVSKKG